MKRGFDHQPRTPRFTHNHPHSDTVNAAFARALADRGVNRAFVRARGVPLPVLPATSAALRHALAGRWSAPAAVTGVVTSVVVATVPYARTLVCPACGATAVDAPGARAAAPCACGAGAVVDDATTYAPRVTATLAPACVEAGVWEEAAVQATGADAVAALTLGSLVVATGVASLVPAVRSVTGPRGLGGVTTPVLKAACVSVPRPLAVVGAPPSLDALIAATRAAGAGRAPSTITLAALLLSCASVATGRGVHVGVRGVSASKLAALARTLTPVVTTPAPTSLLPSMDAGTGAVRCGGLVAARHGVCVVDGSRVPPAALAAVLSAAAAGSAPGRGAVARTIACDGALWCVDPPSVNGSGAPRGKSAAAACGAARAALDVVLPWSACDDDDADADDVLLGLPKVESISVATLISTLQSAAAAPPPRLTPAAAASISAYYAAARSAGGGRGGGHFVETLTRFAVAAARLRGRAAATAADAAVAVTVVDAAAPARVLPKISAGQPLGVAVDSVADALDVLVARAGGRGVRVGEE